MEQTPELKRSLFGYRKQDVESILEVRERMFERVTDEAAQRRAEADRLRADVDKAREETQCIRSELTAQLNDAREELERVRPEVTRLEDSRRDAETRAAGLETEVREARREVAALGERIRVADATEAGLRTRLEEASAASPDTRELGAVIEATQEAIGRIMAGARRAAEEDLFRLQRTRDEMQGEVERVREWRERLEPMAQEIAGEIAIAHAQMSQTAERVGEALRPMSEALTALSVRLQDLGQTVDEDTIGIRPDRVDLVSHERERSETFAEHRAEATRQEAPAGTPGRSDPWPDPRR